MDCKGYSLGWIFWMHPHARKLQFYCDRRRHLVCEPYSVENLHEMARRLKIKRCWFHLNHYDIPKRRIAEVTARCIVVDSKKIVDIIRSMC